MYAFHWTRFCALMCNMLLDLAVLFFIYEHLNMSSAIYMLARPSSFANVILDANSNSDYHFLPLH